MADPYLQIRGWGGWGGGHADPEIRAGGGGGLTKKFFRPFGPQFGPKIKAGGSGPLPRDPSLPFLEAILRIKRRPVLHLLFNENSFSNPHV